MDYITKSQASKLLPKKKRNSHKGEFGSLLIIGGSKTLYGAPVLSALSALRSGCDLVKIIAPEKSAQAYSAMSPNLIVEPVPGTCFNKWHIRSILETSQSCDTVLIGPGLGQRQETRIFVQNLLTRLEKPAIIDADAIKAISSSTKLLKPNHLLTPHSREFSILTGETPGTDPTERTNKTTFFSNKFKSTILLKGSIDIISNGSKTLLNKTGSRFMTKGGTGDVLSGMCGAFSAMSLNLFSSASLSAYLCGKAGEIASKTLGQGMLATDLIDAIPRAIEKMH